MPDPLPTEAYETRPADARDAAIVTLHRHKMFVSMGRPDDEHMKAVAVAFLPWVRAQLEGGRYLGWFATAADRVVAGVGMSLLDWPPGPRDLAPLRGYLLNVYTEPEHRGRGLARNLVRAALEEARLRGIRVVSLHASDAGKGLYASLGFTSTNEMFWIDPDPA